jgi:hypothetical protein
MKKAKDFFNENYKLLKRDIKEDMRRWKDHAHRFVESTL